MDWRGLSSVRLQSIDLFSPPQDHPTKSKKGKQIRQVSAVQRMPPPSNCSRRHASGQMLWRCAATLGAAPVLRGPRWSRRSRWTRPSASWSGSPSTITSQQRPGSTLRARSLECFQESYYYSCIIVYVSFFPLDYHDHDQVWSDLPPEWLNRRPPVKQCVFLNRASNRLGMQRFINIITSCAYLFLIDCGLPGAMLSSATSVC